MTTEPKVLKIGPYQVVRELGRGGLAQVYQALRLYPGGLPKACVIKLPRPSAVVDRAMVEQFKRECRVALLLEHQHIVRAWDMGEHEGLPYLVLDFIAGNNLLQMLGKQRMQAEEWSPESIVHVVRSVGAALIYAHELAPQGKPLDLIHRDVSSKNVMVSGTGGVFLTDFGIASANVIETDMQMLKGTWSYMSPEHVAGQRGPFIDVFGLGTILWEMIMRQRFRGDLDVGDLRRAVIEGFIPEITKTNVPGPLLEVARGWLNPDYHQRMTIHEGLRLLAGYPDGRIKVEEMARSLFGVESRRSGHTHADFVVPDELERALVAGRAFGSGQKLGGFSSAETRVPDSLLRDDDRSLGRKRPGEPTAPIRRELIATHASPEAVVITALEGDNVRPPRREPTLVLPPGQAPVAELDAPKLFRRPRSSAPAPTPTPVPKTEVVAPPNFESWHQGAAPQPSGPCSPASPVSEPMEFGGSHTRTSTLEGIAEFGEGDALVGGVRWRFMAMVGAAVVATICASAGVAWVILDDTKDEHRSRVARDDGPDPSGKARPGQVEFNGGPELVGASVQPAPGRTPDAGLLGAGVPAIAAAEAPVLGPALDGEQTPVLGPALDGEQAPVLGPALDDAVAPAPGDTKAQTPVLGPDLGPEVQDVPDSIDEHGKKAAAKSEKAPADVPEASSSRSSAKRSRRAPSKPESARTISLALRLASATYAEVKVGSEVIVMMFEKRHTVDRLISAKTGKLRWRLDPEAPWSTLRLPSLSANEGVLVNFHTDGPRLLRDKPGNK